MTFCKRVFFLVWALCCALGHLWCGAGEDEMDICGPSSSFDFLHLLRECEEVAHVSTPRKDLLELVYDATQRFGVHIEESQILSYALYCGYRCLGSRECLQEVILVYKENLAILDEIGVWNEKTRRLRALWQRLQKNGSLDYLRDATAFPCSEPIEIKDLAAVFSANSFQKTYMFLRFKQSLAEQSTDHAMDS